MNNQQPQWDLEIRPERHLLDLRLSELWSYRDLLILLVRRDFVSFYKQTILGPAWFFLQPVLTTLMFTFVFGNLAGISTDGLPKPLFYLAGITAWNYFADCLTKTSTVFRDNAHIFGKVYFPRLIMPMSIVISNLIRLGIQILLLVVAVVVYNLLGYHVQPSWALLLFPVILVLMAAFGLGLGMIISALTTKYRDLSFLVSFGVQLLMYATTVIYPLSAAGEDYRIIIEANPMTAVIEVFRFGFLGKGSFDWQSLSYSAAFIFLLLFAGIIVYNKVEKDFVDTV